MARRRGRGGRNSRPPLSVVVGAVLLTGAFAALLFLPAGEPGMDPGGEPADHPGEPLPEAGEASDPGALPESAPRPESAPPARALERGELPPIPTPEDRIRVEVLNAGGVPGMAALATDHLRSLGFDVVYYGNARAFDRDETEVLDRTGTPGAAEAVARAMGVPGAREALDTGPLVDVTVLLGKSWTPPDPEELGPAGEGWWSPRRLLERIRSMDRSDQGREPR